MEYQFGINEGMKVQTSSWPLSNKTVKEERKTTTLHWINQAKYHTIYLSYIGAQYGTYSSDDPQQKSQS